MALDATVGGASSNSYIDRDRATALLAQRLNISNWSSASEADKDAALQMSTTIPESMDWKGVNATTEQALRFPRSGLVTRDGGSIDSDIIPLDVERATAELALQQLTSDTTAEPDTKGFTRLKVASLEMEVDKYDRVGLIPQSVNYLINYLLNSTGSSAKVARV